MANEVARKATQEVGMTDAEMEAYAKALATGIAESRAVTVVGGPGKPLLRLMKNGRWVFGQNNEAVQEGSCWAINIATLEHGWQCWVKDDPTNPKSPQSLKGQVFVKMTEKMPPKPPPIENTDFAQARAFELKCVDGDDAGTEVHYKTNSLGGVRAVWDLTAEIQKRCAVDPRHAFPVVQLDSDSYNHKAFGPIATPMFVIMEWTDFHLNPADDAADANAGVDTGDAGDGESAIDNEPQQPQPSRVKEPLARASGGTSNPKPKAPLTTAANRTKTTTAAPQAAREGQRRRPGR